MARIETPRTYAGVVASGIQSNADVGFVRPTQVAELSEVQKFFVFLRSLPTNISLYLEGEGVCCNIHDPVDLPQDYVGGCADVPIGFHKSIVAVYKKGFSAVTCFAKFESLMLDKTVAREALFIDKMCGGPLDSTVVLGRKYRQGLPIDVSQYGSGYCYLHAFSVGVRSRVARILGPLPLVADVLRVFRVLGDRYVSANWTMVSEGFYHLEPISCFEGGTGANFMRACWRILEVDPDAKIGIDLFKSFGLFNLFQVLGSGDFRRNPSDDVCLDVGDSVEHTGRGCGHVSDAMLRFERSWIGDVVHRLDVRMFVLYGSGIEKKMFGHLENSLLSKEAQASFYDSYEGVKSELRGDSARSKSTAFEISYEGRFRKDYILTVFGDKWNCVPVEYRNGFKYME